MSKDAKSFWFGVTGALVAGVLLWMFTTAASGGVVFAPRFKADSSRRDQRYTRDSSDRVRFETRLEAKVDILICRSLPPAEREACLKK